MRKFVFTCLLTVVLGLTAQPKHEVRAVWLTTIGGIDWPSRYAHDGIGLESQRQELRTMLDRLKAGGINTVLLQTRIRATTIYPSDLEPWDGCLSGKPGVSPGYDALQFAIDECHRRGMELHAWVVTIPVGKWTAYGCQQLRRRHPSLIKKIGDEGYMNPESAATADYLADICKEIVSRYDVDGIHLDYIRYPETWRGTKRTYYITDIVKRIHGVVKFYKPWVKLSCSPIGKYDDLSRYRSNGWNARSRVAQDAQLWLREGWMDQLYPMMYFAGNNFYPFAIDWQEQAAGRTVVSGLGVYMLHPRERNWPIGEVKRQLNVTRNIGMGHCYFRAKFFLDNVKGVYDYATWFDRHPALIPPMTWASQEAPEQPATLTVEHTATGDNVTWGKGTDRSDGPYLLYNVYASQEWPVDITRSENLIATRRPWRHISVKRTGKEIPLHYAVTSLDRYGNESRATQENEQRHATVNSKLFINNDGQTLNIRQQTAEVDAEYVAVCSMQGNILATSKCKPHISIAHLPEGVYELKSLNRKGVTHHLGFFIIRR